MPSRHRPLTIAMSDAWLLAAEALMGGRREVAQSLADHAVALSGWQRYRLVYGEFDAEIRKCELLLQDWAYHAVNGREQLLLVHPVAAPFFVLAPDFPAMMRAARDAGEGLLPLEGILVAGVLSELQPPIPDSPADLI